ncbi:MAG: sugar transferase [Candidatus Aegiribacteria sp.]|nr:sugar transferase [Candidatus Aegiribacteria sp.]
MGKFKLGVTLDRAFALGAFVLDLIVVYVSLAFAHFLRFGNLSSIWGGHLLGTWAFYSLFFVLITEMEGLHFTRTTVNRSLLGFRGVRVSMIVTMLYTVVMFLFRLPADYFMQSRFIVVLSFFCLVLFYFLLRVVAFPYVFRLLIRPFMKGKIRVTVFGDSEHYRTLRALCRKSPVYLWYLELVHVEENEGKDREEWIKFLVEHVRDQGMNDLCVCDDGALFEDFALSAWSLYQKGIQASFFSEIFEKLRYFDPWLSTSHRMAMIFFTGKMNRLSKLLWRAFDIMLSFVALLILLPFMLLIALAIKLESRGPALFVQNRVGLDLEHFAFPKFRSMMHDPKGGHEKAHKEYFEKYANGMAADSESENGFKLKNKSRITRMGRVLRRTSLDELPQLWCVLTGKMSLVGPRPCIPYELEHYKDWQKLRFTVKPGLTGIWQVYGRSRLPMDAAQFMDFCYVLNRSIGLNVRLILKTVPIMLIGRGGM